MDKIDKVIYINLESRQDRRQSIEHELNQLGVEYERFNAIATPGFGILGCGKSHLAVIELAKQRGYQNVLILEDDTHFVLDRKEIDLLLNQFFDSKIDYDVLFLSYVIYSGEDTPYPFLRRGLHTTTATAYIVNCHYYDELINLYQFSTKMLEQTREHWNYANDLVWKDLQKKDKWYCITPIIAIQQSGYSDNSMSYQDYTSNYKQYYRDNN
jgi:GR25 family glycosyltransferase involved in LPS biosynthesis